MTTKQPIGTLPPDFMLPDPPRIPDMQRPAMPIPNPRAVI